MTAALHPLRPLPAGPPTPDPWASEWARVEQLASILAEARTGREASEPMLRRLGELQSDVAALRRRGEGMASLLPTEVSPLEIDVVTVALAIEAAPRLGWQLQSLPPGAPQPWPSPALLAELFGLEGEGVRALRAAVGEGAHLLRQGLIERDGFGGLDPIRPGRSVIARLFGHPVTLDPPPGATQVPGRAGWNDLVLPEEALVRLRELLLWLQHKDMVEGDWGGAAAGGPVALFAGPSGTGKTLAAKVIAGALGWPLFRVDLGLLVSKYIGETEKNLSRLFDAAAGAAMVLLFDEADSLFGRRGEVKEARDRYASMEVGHLLARLEAHVGPCILTTNLRKHLDPAFLRRFHVVVEFPRPDVAARACLWCRHLPPRAPLAADLAPDLLGAAVALTGGQIRNSALHAAYLAAGDGRPIGLDHAALAIWRELSKDGRTLARSDLGALEPHLARVHG